MYSKVGKVLITLFLLTVVLCSIFQFYRYMSKPFKTETVINYTVADSIPSDGIVIREETAMGERPQGVCRYVNELGSKVLKGHPVAEVFSSETDVINRNLSEYLAVEIADLEDAQQSSQYYSANTTALSNQISELIGDVIDLSYKNVTLNLQDRKQELTLLLNRKQISIGKETSFADRIEQLKQEKANVDAAMGSVLSTINAPVTGYFSKTVDGFEDLKITDVQDMTIQQIKDLVASQREKPSELAGKIVTNPNWYFAAVVPKEYLERFNSLKGSPVYLDFNLINTRTVESYVYRIIEEVNSEDMIVIFRCDILSEEIMSLRNQSVDIQFRTCSGLRVSQEAIRYVDNVRGVYVLEEYEVKFKPIDPDPSYEDSNFLICSDNYGGEDGLKLYDEIIVEGTDLYDGKPVK